MAVRNNELYLDRDPLGDVHDQLYVGVVVVVGAPRHGHIVVRHFDVLYKETRVIPRVKEKRFLPHLGVYHPAWVCLTGGETTRPKHDVTYRTEAHRYLHWPSGPQA